MQTANTRMICLHICQSVRVGSTYNLCGLRTARANNHNVHCTRRVHSKHYAAFVRQYLPVYLINAKLSRALTRLFVTPLPQTLACSSVDLLSAVRLLRCSPTPCIPIFSWRVGMIVMRFALPVRSPMPFTVPCRYMKSAQGRIRFTRKKYSSNGKRSGFSVLNALWHEHIARAYCSAAVLRTVVTDLRRSALLSSTLRHLT